jgi:hypothetical protein
VILAKKPRAKLLPSCRHHAPACNRHPPQQPPGLPHSPRLRLPHGRALLPPPLLASFPRGPAIALLRTGLFMNLRVISRASGGRVAENTPTCVG